MALQSKYDPRQDRMLLTVNLKKDEASRTFWLTRLQWLMLMHQVSAVSARPVDDGGALPPRKSPPQALPPQPEAVLLDSLKLGREGDTVKVRLGASEDAITLALKEQQLANFQRMLVTQAERAGWDPRAAMERLAAARAARVAMKRAKGG